MQHNALSGPLKMTSDAVAWWNLERSGRVFDMGEEAFGAERSLQCNTIAHHFAKPAGERSHTSEAKILEVRGEDGDASPT